MEYPNLRATFREFSNQDPTRGAGAKDCDVIAKIISQRGEAYAASLEKHIGFGNDRRESAATDSSANSAQVYRRLAMLIERIDPSGDRKLAQQASSLEQSELDNYVRAAAN